MYSQKGSSNVVRTLAAPPRAYDGGFETITPSSYQIKATFTAVPIAAGTTSAKKGKYKVTATPTAGGATVVAESYPLLTNNGAEWPATSVSVLGLTADTEYMVEVYFDNDAA